MTDTEIYDFLKGHCVYLLELKYHNIKDKFTLWYVGRKGFIHDEVDDRVAHAIMDKVSRKLWTSRDARNHIIEDSKGVACFQIQEDTNTEKTKRPTERVSYNATLRESVVLAIKKSNMVFKEKSAD